VTHARLQRRNEATGTGATGAKAKAPSRTLSQTALAGIIDSLERMIKSLRLKNAKTEWGQYYQDTNYSDSSFTHKKTVVEDFLKTLMPERVLDLGANNGLFSRIAVAQGAFVISSDIDPLAVELNYREMKTKGETNLLPLLVDLTNPSPAIGWANRERRAFSVRVTADVVMALALIHHLAIGNNVPFELISSYFAELGPHLIIEFVPKTDTQVERLLVGREDIFSDYSEAGFERAFGTRYEIVDKVTLTSPKRTLYLMKRR
jgi:ribosomal protein L11 methylase PrmA